MYRRREGSSYFVSSVVLEIPEDLTSSSDELVSEVAGAPSRHTPFYRKGLCLMGLGGTLALGGVWGGRDPRWGPAGGLGQARRPMVPRPDGPTGLLGGVTSAQWLFFSSYWTSIQTMSPEGCTQVVLGQGPEGRLYYIVCTFFFAEGCLVPRHWRSRVVPPKMTRVIVPTETPEWGLRVSDMIQHGGPPQMAKSIYINWGWV